MKLKNYVFLYIILAVHSVFAQVEFVARVSKKQLGINEHLRIEFSMNKEGDHFKAPSFKGFNVIGGPIQSVSHNWMNGKRSFSKTYAYVLSPKRKGNIVINKASIEINDETYNSKPVKILVTSPVIQPENPNNPNYIASKNIHLVTEISNTNPYVNEAITLVQKLYVHPSIGINDFKTITDPKLTGFWSQDFTNRQLKVERGQYKGNPYNYVILKRTILYPQTTGKIKIKPLVLNVQVSIPTNKRDFFGQRITQSVRQKVAAKTRILKVKELPIANKPDNFTGAVGQFEFDVITNKTAVKSGESLQTIVRVKGKGNLKLFELPKLVVPSSLEVYEPEHNENIKITFSGMRGSIKDTYTIVPQYKGNYPISELEFSYFNPKKKQYITLKSVTHMVDVLTGVTSTVPTPVTQQKTEVNDNQFHSFKTETNLIPIKKTQFFRTTLFWYLLMLPLLLIPILLIIKKQRERFVNDIHGNKLRKADRLAKKYLSESKKNLNNKEAFYEALHKALHNYLKAKLQIETIEFSVDKIKRTFNEKNVENTTTTQFIELIENCNLARFTPMSDIEMKQDYNKAVQIINKIDKIL